MSEGVGQETRVFSGIRESCAAVCAQARHAVLQVERIPAYAASLPQDRIGLDGLDAATHLLGQGEQTLAYMLALDSINFGSGYFPHLAKRPGMSGYFTVAAGLKDWFETTGPITPSALRALNTDLCAEIFAQEPSNPVAMELMFLFAQALNALGELVERRFQGSFPLMVESAEHSASRFIGKLCEMPFFRDELIYQGQPVRFYKRAQITCADLALAFSNRHWGQFDDIDELTSFADNLVPHVLSIDGVLQYSPALTQLIDDGRLVEPGSPEEIELRAAAVHGVELIRAALADQGTHVNSMRLDFLLWNRGQGAQYKSMPRHRARSVFY